MSPAAHVGEVSSQGVIDLVAHYSAGPHLRGGEEVVDKNTSPISGVEELQLICTVRVEFPREEQGPDQLGLRSHNRERCCEPAVPERALPNILGVRLVSDDLPRLAQGLLGGRTAQVVCAHDLNQACGIPHAGILDACGLIATLALHTRSKPLHRPIEITRLHDERCLFPAVGANDLGKALVDLLRLLLRLRHGRDGGQGRAAPADKTLPSRAVLLFYVQGSAQWRKLRIDIRLARRCTELVDLLNDIRVHEHVLIAEALKLDVDLLVIIIGHPSGHGRIGLLLPRSLALHPLHGHPHGRGQLVLSARIHLHGHLHGLQQAADQLQTLLYRRHVSRARRQLEGSARLLCEPRRPEALRDVRQGAELLSLERAGQPRSRSSGVGNCRLQGKLQRQHGRSGLCSRGLRDILNGGT
mmetsp:Transcript_58469/g.190680  ORF Transcript_58469/g.190680 Transcript_58469/m.190680 type:complete len:413 (-) Transcript_58469:81-1319(-)